MKKFIFSLLIGSIVGTGMGVAFLFITPKLPAIFADAFFYPVTEPVSYFKLATSKIKFKPESNQYLLESVDTIPQEGKVVYANLALKTIHLYENGEQKSTYSIKSIGREGTAWQTPLGNFDMSYKKENHFSSIGSVWMPYSMHFFGNYFIHGWPYYPGGKPVAEGYSGGCIRMDTPDAQAIFEFVDEDTQLIVTNTTHEIVNETDFEYIRKEKLPEIQGNYMIADIESGEVIVSSTKDSIPARSFTNLMTALISLETLNQYQETIFDQNIVTVADVLYPLVLADNHDAGNILLMHKNKSQFLKDMNTRAESLDMKGTVFADAIGEDTKTVTTFDDMVQFVMYLKEYKPFLMKVLELSEYKTSSFKIDSLYEMKEYSAGGLRDNENRLQLSLITHDVPSSKDATPSASKTFLVIVHDVEDAKQVTEDLYTWITTSLVRR